MAAVVVKSLADILVEIAQVGETEEQREKLVRLTTEAYAAAQQNQSTVARSLHDHYGSIIGPSHIDKGTWRELL